MLWLLVLEGQGWVDAPARPHPHPSLEKSKRENGLRQKTERQITHSLQRKCQSIHEGGSFRTPSASSRPHHLPTPHPCGNQTSARVLLGTSHLPTPALVSGTEELGELTLAGQGRATSDSSRGPGAMLVHISFILVPLSTWGHHTRQTACQKASISTGQAFAVFHAEK